MTAEALTVENLEVSYEPGLPIVQGANLAVEAGEIMVILGPNGAGKSSLAKAEKITALNSTGTIFPSIEHNMDLVASLCRSVKVMAEGRLLVSGNPADVLLDPRVIAAYLGTQQGTAA